MRWSGRHQTLTRHGKRLKFGADPSTGGMMRLSGGSCSLQRLSVASRMSGFANPPLSRFDLIRPGRQSIMKSIAPGDGPCGFTSARLPALRSRYARLSRMSSHSDNAHGILPFAVLFSSSGAERFPIQPDPHAVSFAFASINFRRGEHRRVLVTLPRLMA